MAKSEHLAKLKKGVKAWNEWRAAYRDSEIDLTECDLSRTDLTSVWLTGADMRGVDLHEANLTKANLIQTNLSRANMQGSDLTRADLREATLIRTNMKGAKLHGVDLTAASLNSADLAGAVLDRVNLNDVDLSNVQGLEQCTHVGPSSVGIDTFFQSNGAIPETFLRGCGVPEQFITLARSLVTSPIEFYSCFISYSSQDQVFAERLNADLRAKNLRCWFAPEDLKIGDRFQERIEDSIRLFDKVMVVLSDASMKSRWVEREVNAAREREDRENRTVLFPIRIDDAVMDATQPWAADIRRSRHIGDFSGWKDHESYSKGFERLLRDLKADGAKVPNA